MGPCIARSIVAAALACPLVAGAQANAPAPGAAAQGTSAAVRLPPQNYGAQPGFFRSAPEMAAFERADAGVIPATAPAQPAAAPAVTPAHPMAAPAVATTVVAAPAAPERVPDPTQNLQWAERQMDRSEATAAQQRQLTTTPPPVAPGAYNGATDPADR